MGWLVTAPYVVPRMHPYCVPWGEYHLRRDGAQLTACGVYAVEWHVFWGHDIAANPQEACRVCLWVSRESECADSPDQRQPA